MTAIATLIITFLEILRPQLQEILQIGKNTVQAVLIVTRMMGCNGLLKKVTKTYRKTLQVITHMMTTTSCNTLAKPQRTTNRNQAQTTNRTIKQKLNDDNNSLYQPYYTSTPEESDNQ